MVDSWWLHPYLTFWFLWIPSDLIFWTLGRFSLYLISWILRTSSIPEHLLLIVQMVALVRIWLSSCFQAAAECAITVMLGLPLWFFQLDVCKLDNLGRSSNSFWHRDSNKPVLTIVNYKKIITIIYFCNSHKDVHYAMSFSSRRSFPLLWSWQILFMFQDQHLVIEWF